MERLNFQVIEKMARYFSKKKLINKEGKKFTA